MQVKKGRAAKNSGPRRPACPAFGRSAEHLAQNRKAQHGQSTDHLEPTDEERCDGRGRQQPESEVSVQPQGGHRGEQQDGGQVVSHDRTRRCRASCGRRQ
jgi:hypothetical protein